MEGTAQVLYVRLQALKNAMVLSEIEELKLFFIELHSFMDNIDVELIQVVVQSMTSKTI